MTNTTSTNAQQPASPAVPYLRDWTKPALDILALGDAEVKFQNFIPDGNHRTGRSR